MLKFIPKFWWPLFFIFVLHQVLEKIFDFHFQLADNFLDPLLAMPILLGLVLAQKRYFLRLGNEHRLSLFEITVIAIAFAFLFEYGLSNWAEGFYFDPIDFGCYFLGTIFFLWRQ